jgi:hypothetical protein
MSARLEIVRAVVKTPLGKEVKEFILMRAGRVIARRIARVAQTNLEKSVSTTAILVAAAIAEAAQRVYPRFLKKYPFLARFDQRVWAETIARLLNRGREDLRALRGVIVERFVPDMQQMTGLLKTLEKRVTKGWTRPRLVSGARTPDGTELADWLIISEGPNGELWIMAIIESKSISNTRDLVRSRGRDVGQHLWDYLRMKSEGLVLQIEGEVRTFRPRQIQVNPVPLGAPPPKSGLTTELIAVTPREFTAGELRNLSHQGANITRWPWPVDEDEMSRLIRDVMNEFK